ncbi:2-oxoglutarate dehydrogenase, E2 component, dihydrolipoamide succinyltransferase, partial [Enterococcus faecalis]
GRWWAPQTAAARAVAPAASAAGSPGPRPLLPRSPIAAEGAAAAVMAAAAAPLLRGTGTGTAGPRAAG